MGSEMVNVNGVLHVKCSRCGVLNLTGLCECSAHPVPGVTVTLAGNTSPGQGDTAELTTLRQRLAEAEARAEDFKRIGQGFERDMRKHFQQSCDNLQRAEKAEADAARWEEAARVLGKAVAMFSDNMYCHSGCEARLTGGACTCGEETLHNAVMKPVDANPTASALVREGGGGTA